MWDIGERKIRRVTIASIVAVFLAISCGGGGTETKERVINRQKFTAVEVPKSKANSSLSNDTASKDVSGMTHETGKIEPYDKKTFAFLTSDKTEVQLSNGAKRLIVTLKVTSETTPIDVLKYLATRSDAIVRFDFKMLGLQKEQFHFPRGWIGRTDVENVIQYVSSVQPASPVVSGLSSKIPEEFRSTIGIEAMAILDAYRGVMYPPLNTGYDYCRPDRQQPKAAEFINWWQNAAGEE